MLLIPAIASLFKHKSVGGIIVLTCWSAVDRVNFARQFSRFGMTVGFSCNSTALDRLNEERFNGVLYIPFPGNTLKGVDRKYFSHWYKWLLINEIPEFIASSRYDLDAVLLHTQGTRKGEKLNGDVKDFTFSTHKFNCNEETNSITVPPTVFFDDIYVHPSDGISSHAWAYWDKFLGLQLLHERERILRRFDLKRYTLKIATPIGYFSEDWYNGSFSEYLVDMTVARERDAGIRCAYATSVLLTEALNAEDVLVPTKLWSTEVSNSSMLLMLQYGSADLAGGVLRILPERLGRVDYAMGIWPFRVGFSYISERESSSNLFVEPFSSGVWWTCFGIVVIMALAQRITAKKPVEKEGAFMAVLATYLQQDASAVPEGVSGRWTFVILSISSMLVHAYYTSAIVSDLMSSGRSGPDSLRALADSRYAIASEDYDYMRYLMFDVETNWEDLEYLKRKKKTSRFYVNLEHGIELLRLGNTAFHTEYNHLYPHLRMFTDDQLCKLQYVDTIPEILSWVTTTYRSQWLNIFRSKGRWFYEVGLAQELLSRFKLLPPPCRAALLAEKVKFGDVVPAILVSVLGAILSLFILAMENIFFKIKRRDMLV